MSKTEVSDRKRNANRANALKSTGPRTADGKSRSRFNAVTHGLRAETVVLPHEDAAAFEAERLGWIEDWKPESQTRMVLVERAAAQSWRLRRCVRVETARLTKIANKAAADYDRSLNDRLSHGLRLLEVHPCAGLEALGNDPEGIDVLIGSWTVLGRALEGGPEGWNSFEGHHGRLMNLLGLPSDIDPNHVNGGAVASSRLLRSNLGELTEEDAVTADEASRIAVSLGQWAKGRADLLIRSLANYGDPAAFRAREIDAACFDASPEALALHRYEATHDRAFKATVGQLMQMAKTGIDLIAPNEATDDVSGLEVDVCEIVVEEPAESKAVREARPIPASPNEATDEASRAVERDREGRIWGVEDSDPGLMNQ